MACGILVPLPGIEHVPPKSLSVMSDSLGPRGLYSPRNSPGQNTGVGSLSLLQGISPLGEPWGRFSIALAQKFLGFSRHVVWTNPKEHLGQPSSCSCLCSAVSISVRPRGLGPARLLCPWDCPGKSTGVGCHFLLQGIFLTQGSNPRLLYLLHWDSLPLSRLGSHVAVAKCILS